jgi:DNA-binding SARP family transcriptional activator
VLNESAQAATGARVAGVIQTKLRPPNVPDAVTPRRRVERRLEDLLACQRVIVVCAAAGSGKTTLVAKTCARLGRPVAWLTVDRSEAAPGRLVTYLEAALARVVPQADCVVRDALSSGLSHGEAAGLLAESVAGTHAVLVLDDLERLGRSPGAWQVLESLLRYLPPDATVVLLSRHEIPTDLCRHPGHDVVGQLDDAVLAFTAEEASQALTRLGLPADDAGAAVEATNGWVTGVLFSRPGGGVHVTGLGSESEPLYEYLSSQIVEQLDPLDRRFLIATSLLDEVDVDRATALGLADAGERLRSLRAVHLPATWHPTGLTLRCHSYFREYLQERFNRMGQGAVRDLRLAHARLLADEERDEDAVEEFIRAGVPEAAVEAAMRSIDAVVDRLDVEIAERWVRVLSPAAPPGASPLVTAELMVAISRENVGQAVRIADRLAERGERDRLAREAPRAAWLMTWGYLHAGRFADVDAILEQVRPGAELDAARYAMGALRDVPGAGADEPAPDLSSSTLDALIYAGSYARGRLMDLTEGAPSAWVDALERPWRIGALRALGRTRQALGLLELTLAEGVVNAPPLFALIGPEVLIDARRREPAAAMIERGRAAGIATGSLVFQSLNRVVEAKLALRLDRDPTAAKRALSEPECRRGAREMRLVGELWDMWMGCALLLEDRSCEALEHLRRCTEGMRAGNRVLELPTALVYLAEAAARVADDELADTSAEAAVAAAAAQGSDHLLLQALADFPSVCARRREEAGASDGRWDDLRRALAVQRAAGPAMPRPLVTIAEFGRHAVLVEDVPAKARVGKTFELLSYLMTVAGRCAHRDELQAVLFGGRRDKSSRSHLRMAIQGVRTILPDGFAQIRDGGYVAIDPQARIAAESIEFETRIAEAARGHGSERLSETLEALAIYDRGEYLSGEGGLWADDRAVRLFAMATEARHQAALLAFGAGRYEESQELVERVLADEPGRESGWRLRMRLAAAVGDENGVLKTYKQCADVLAPLGLEPSTATRALLERLRR